MRELTKAQMRVLVGMELLGLSYYRNSWAENYWKQGTGRVMGRTAEVLLERGLIELGEERQLDAGRKIARADVTPAGRALLAEARDEN